MKTPKQRFAVSLEKAVREYHEYHQDKNVKLVGFVCNPIGDALLLTRVTDMNGKKQSCLLEFYYNGDWDIHENDSAEREHEYELLCDYMGDVNGC